jgi:Ca2+-binding EF-hand superfamily protein
MTVSNLYFNFDMKDAQQNFEEFNLEDPNERGDLQYDIKDKVFLEFRRTLVLGTTASFGYSATEDEVAREIGKMLNKTAKKVTEAEVEA